MQHALIIILCLSALINLVLALWLIGSMADVKFFQKDSSNWYNRWVECKMKQGSGKMSTVPAEVMQKMNDLQNENATLRTDNETGCQLIDKQRIMIAEQTNKLNSLIAENRRIMHSFKHKK
jgi:hypothetical protein